MLSSHRLLTKAFTNIFSITNFQSTLIYSFSDNKDKLQKYEYPFNFNQQQYRGYIKKVQKAKKDISAIQQKQQGNIIPRRKRRIYDKPRFDTDISTYSVWRMFDPEQTMLKTWQHGLVVKAKLILQPKWVIHAFGQGILTVNNMRSSHRQYIFEDNNLSKFLLYEYRNTTYFKQNQVDFDYQNQQHLRPQMRKIKRLSPEDFWKSQQYFEFRLNCTQYAEHLKFCKWIQQTIEKSKNKQSYDQFINKKFSTAYCFNQKKDMELFVPNEPLIKYVTPESFEIKKEKEQKEQKQAKTGKKDKQQKVTQQKKPTEVPPAQTKTETQTVSKFVFTQKLDDKFRREIKQTAKVARKSAAEF